ncbi:MAG: IPT/TIG domain-containing protein [Planctomycetes bacterium]|nr:IPT/TIG domain-containing protein [Planctomycetota bacterium]MBI3844201.1 IPT/TIG domain-containing protein [Planctomycetota bacterium]
MFSKLAYACGVALAVGSGSSVAVGQVEWAPLHPPTSPAGRSHGAMAYDSARSRMVLFSGYLALSDTWEWDGLEWRRLFPRTRPPERLTSQMAYDSVRGECLVFGGPDQGPGPLADTWVWDGTNWARRFPPTSPGPRWDGALAFDSGRGRVVMFGGSDTSGFLAETWEWDGATWTQRTPLHSPPARENGRLAYDLARARTVLFGGSGVLGLLNDTWEWNGDDWVHVFPLTIPPARSQFGFDYDAQRRRSIAVGGLTTNGLQNDAWEWNGVDWSPIVPTRAPSVRFGMTMAYDSSCGRTVLFGGADEGPVALSDTWVLSVPPTATTIVPSVGAESGGDLVVIDGGAFTEASDLTVAFGGAAATVIDVACGRVRVLAPPGSGVVDVAISDSLGRVVLTAGFTYVPDAIAARFGNVNSGRGDRENVLLVNGNVGDVSRELEVRVGQAIDAAVTSPSSRAESQFVLYAWTSAPDATTLTRLPRQLGAMVFPPPFIAAIPQPRAVWNNVGRFRRLGPPTAPSSPAPSLVFRRPHGARAPGAVALQGLIQDDGSRSSDGFSVTNAVVVNVVP